MSDQSPPDSVFDKNGLSFDAGEKLKSCVIVAYEQALRHGLPPSGALAIILDWVAEECARIRED